ncbi:MAG TPA: SAM-dependent methyltransferase, partial [Erythrobacter sp.]|nr:SAM-dependent methyltransferase [Erythrobacter sp.]
MKRHAPATARNSQPLAEVLARELPASGTVLEIASGSGEHAVFMARRFPALDWQPSDRDAEALASVDAWAAEARLANLRPA